MAVASTYIAGSVKSKEFLDFCQAVFLRRVCVLVPVIYTAHFVADWKRVFPNARWVLDRLPLQNGHTHKYYIYDYIFTRSNLQKDLPIPQSGQERKCALLDTSPHLVAVFFFLHMR